MMSGKSPAALRRGSPRYEDLISKASLIADIDEIPQALGPLWGARGARSVADLLARWCSMLDAAVPPSKRDLTGAYNIRATNPGREDYQQSLLKVASRQVERGDYNSINRAMQMSETLDIGESIFAAIDQWIPPVQEALRTIQSAGENAASNVLWAFMVRKGWTNQDHLGEMVFGLAWLYEGVQREGWAVIGPTVELLSRSGPEDHHA